MGLKKLCLRYHPPGIILEFTRKGIPKTKNIDLLSLTADNDPEMVAEELTQSEPLISRSFDVIKSKLYTITYTV